MEKQTERTELWIQGGAGEEGSQRVRCMERGESNAQTYTTVSKIDS